MFSIHIAHTSDLFLFRLVVVRVRFVVLVVPVAQYHQATIGGKLTHSNFEIRWHKKTNVALVQCPMIHPTIFRITRIKSVYQINCATSGRANYEFRGLCVAMIPAYFVEIVVTEISYEKCALELKPNFVALNGIQCSRLIVAFCIDVDNSGSLLQFHGWQQYRGSS